MDTNIIYHSALVLHIAGLTAMAGTTVANYVLFKQFWKQYTADKEKAMGTQQSTAKLARLFGIGFLLLIISGVTMMGITHGVFGEQLWFRIKFALILIIIINGLTFGRKQGVQLRRLLAENGDQDKHKIARIKSNLNLFHISQLAFFITIYTLSVFKFN